MLLSNTGYVNNKETNMKKNFSINLIFAFFVMIVFLNANSVSANQNRSLEVDKFITMLESSLQNQRINAAKLITRSGLSDPRLFSVINKKLLNEYKLYPQNREHLDEISWTINQHKDQIHYDNNTFPDLPKRPMI